MSHEPMVFAVVSNSIMKFVGLVVLMYSFNDPETIANTSRGITIIEIHINATNSIALTTAFVVFQFMILSISSISSHQ